MRPSRGSRNMLSSPTVRILVSANGVNRRFAPTPEGGGHSNRYATRFRWLSAQLKQIRLLGSERSQAAPTEFGAPARPGGGQDPRSLTTPFSSTRPLMKVGPPEKGSRAGVSPLLRADSNVSVEDRV